MQVSWLSLKTKVDGLSVVWPQNHWDSFIRFDLKIGGDDFLQFRLKTGGNSFSQFGIKLVVEGFPVWASKQVASVWLFGHQNHRGGFLVWASKPSG
jgi:hypothetical protein